MGFGFGSPFEENQTQNPVFVCDRSGLAEQLFDHEEHGPKGVSVALAGQLPPKLRQLALIDLLHLAARPSRMLDVGEAVADLDESCDRVGAEPFIIPIVCSLAPSAAFLVRECERDLRNLFAKHGLHVIVRLPRILDRIVDPSAGLGDLCVLWIQQMGEVAYPGCHHAQMVAVGQIERLIIHVIGLPVNPNPEFLGFLDDGGGHAYKTRSTRGYFPEIAASAEGFG